RFNEQRGKAKGPTLTQKKALADKSLGALKFSTALLNWGGKGFEWASGLVAMKEANKLNIDETAYWLGERTLQGMKRDEKLKKESLVDLMTQFEECNGFDLAVTVGELAIQMDPSDQALSQQVKNLSAQSTMAQGGFDSTGQGGFKGRIRDQEAQQKLAASDSLVKTEGTLEEQIQDAVADYKRRPDDMGAIERAARMLRQRGGQKDLDLARKILLKAHKENNVYRLKEQAGEIELRMYTQALDSLEGKLAASPGDTELAEKAESLRKKRREIEVREITERVQNYPTDLALKYELGRLHYEAGEYEQAIEQFQLAKGAKGKRGRVLLLLGESFLELGWADESVATFRQAIEQHRTMDDDLGLAFRYGLMRALRTRAENEEDVSAADEAFDIASKIAVEQIGYKDIREQREVIMELRKKLKGS
ncbi:MAG: tetratricopeptide repeat protein, partial [Planctomycetota bacterium]